jgi:hypothetical protein
VSCSLPSLNRGGKRIILPDMRLVQTAQVTVKLMCVDSCECLFRDAQIVLFGHKECSFLARDIFAQLNDSSRQGSLLIHQPDSKPAEVQSPPQDTANVAWESVYTARTALSLSVAESPASRLRIFGADAETLLANL